MTIQRSPKMHTPAQTPRRAAELKSVAFLGAVLSLLLVYVGLEVRASDEVSAPETGMTKLVPPVTAEGSKVTGSGSKRTGKITIKNTAKHGITRLELAEFFLAPDDWVVRVASEDVTFNLGTLRPGQSTTVDVDATFMGKDEGATSVVGVIQVVEFDDGSSWPPLPARAPAADGDAPVGLAMMGVVGTPPLAVPLIHCHNHGDKEVDKVVYYIEFIAGDGTRLDATNMIESVGGNAGGLKSKAGTVLVPSFRVPEAAKRAEIHLTNVFFSDETVWQAPQFR
jgi:hypothetical protein